MKLIGEAAFDELDSLFQRDLECRRKQNVQMVRHDNKCVQSITPLITIVLEHFNQ